MVDGEEDNANGGDDERDVVPCEQYGQRQPAPAQAYRNLHPHSLRSQNLHLAIARQSMMLVFFSSAASEGVGLGVRATARASFFE